MPIAPCLLLAAIAGASAQPAAPPAEGPAVSSPSWSMAEAAREAVARSPEVSGARRRAEEAGLAEPMILANLDPRFEGSFLYADDRAPRAAPLFQGSRARTETLEAGVAQNTLLGTRTRLFYRSERLTNPTPFRSFDPSVDSRLALEISQPLWRYLLGRPDIARRRRARAGAAAAAARLRQAVEAAASGAARAYAELYHARRLIAIRQAGVEDAMRLLDKWRERRRYGMAEPSDLLQAEAAVEIQQTELDSARAQAARAQFALSAALRRDGPFPLELAAPEGPAGAPLAESEALSRRAELVAARAERETLEWAARIERLDTMPDLSLSASYAFAGLNREASGSWNDLRTLDHPVASAGLRLSVPFGFRRERLLRRQARLRFEAAAAEEQRVEAGALRELRDAREVLSLARRRLEAGRRLASLERRKYAAEEENFRRGRSTTDLLLRFQQDIRRAEAELLRAEVDEALARVELARACGTLIEALGL